VIEELHVVVLAAGKGTRMRSELPKVLHRAAGLPLIEWVLRLARSLEPASITMVLGHGADQVRAELSGAADVRFVLQEPQLGTGHALLQARPLLAGRPGTVVLLSGDVPLLTRRSLERVVAIRRELEAAVVVASAHVPDPTGYGRIVRKDGALERIVEHRDATDDERQIKEINSGVYAFAMDKLFESLAQVGSGNAQGEYYLPELVDIARRSGRAVHAEVLSDAHEILGVNTRVELAALARMLRARTNTALMESGVTLVDPDTAYIDPDVRIGPDTVVHPSVSLEGRTSIGVGCELQSGVRIVDSTLGNQVSVLNHSVVQNSTVADDAKIGPFARLRPQSVICEHVHIGNFVEIKKSEIGAGSKIGHLSYVGDASVGAGVNIGAGTITCNYDGVTKHKTAIGDRAFIGSDTTLIAPVSVGEGAYIAAGSAITEDVPGGALGVARSRQTVKPGWATQRFQTTPKSSQR